MKLLPDPARTARINEGAYPYPPNSTNRYTSINCIEAPIELNAKKSTYCFRILVEDEKSVSSNVQILFNKKFEVIETAIPPRVACIYQRVETFESKSDAK
jgi:hypothetical protein